ncbi:lipopolysaccharide biosynthesis protein [Parabacteroides sp. ZJ-118]|uniref:lipopolysaccharide biosynthesis protein n=1 Tax=Parabacteroides sp. ZJ-118 TaxID=2709398 RepID=UPI0013EDABDC|nr:oligosaccharide flippase family protein [Parabacteroides sp. ZJ-118]
MNIRSFFKGEERTVKAKKNILASFFIKGVDSLVYLLLVPVTLGYINPYEYGIWLTLNSILMWINSFDIGLGNGMRNKLAETMAKGDRTLGRIYVSTTFFMLVALMLILIVIGTLFAPLIDWYDILGATQDRVPHLNEIVYISFVIFCLNFIFKFIGNVYLAMQLPAVNNLMVVSGHLLSLIIIYVFTFTVSGSLFWVAIVYSASPLVVYLIAYPVTFNKIYPYFKPSIHFFKKEYVKELFNLSMLFFLLQLSGILLFAFSNLLISHMFGPENVTPYNISYRYFSIMPMLINLILAPMWSATTDAYAKGDMSWIKRTMDNVKKILIFASAGLILMVVISEYVYQIWIGTEVHIPIIMSLVMSIYICILIWSLAFSNFLNGLGKLRIQTINTIAVAILYVPISYILGKHLGIIGILVGMCVLNSSGLIFNYIQFNKVINGTSKGIWDK